MKVLDPVAASLTAQSPRPDRPATTTIHDSADVRLLVFRISPGQQVPPHRSTSTVLLIAMEGTGFFTHADGEHAVAPGSCVAYEPNELHGMRAVEAALVVLAVIAPRPGARSIPA